MVEPHTVEAHPKVICLFGMGVSQNQDPDIGLI